MPVIGVTSQIEELLSYLHAESRRIGSVNPQYSYYERLVLMAEQDSSLLDHLYREVTHRGGFAGL